MEQERRAHFYRIGWGAEYERQIRAEWRQGESKKIKTDSTRQELDGIIRRLNLMYDPPARGIPHNIRRGMEIRTIARFRCGNEERSLQACRGKKGYIV